MKITALACDNCRAIIYAPDDRPLHADEGPARAYCMACGDSCRPDRPAAACDSCRAEFAGDFEAAYNIRKAAGL